MPISNETIQRGAIEIPMRRSDPGSPQRSILMVHGIFSEKTEDGRFSRLADELCIEGTAAWQFDFQGHGDSKASSQSFTVAAALADFIVVADAHRQAYHDVPRSIIASSFGGSVVLLAALAGHLEKLAYDKLILLNPVTDYRSSFLEPFGQQMQEIFTPAALQELRTVGEARVQPDFVLSLPVLLEFELLRPSEGFSHLSARTLILQGDQDTAVSHDIVRRDSGASAHVDFRTIEGAAHAFAEPGFERLTFDLMKEFLMNR